MASYLVLERPRQGAAEPDFRLVRDRFAWLAFLFPVLWALAHRLWIETLVLVVLTALVGALGSLPSLAGIMPFVGLALMMLFGMEANAIRAAALRRRGYADWGVVEADSAGDAEIRYLSERYGDAPPPAPRPVLGRANPAQGAPALGLLGYGTGR